MPGWVRCKRQQMKRTRNVSPTIHDGTPDPLMSVPCWISKMAAGRHTAHTPPVLVPRLRSASLIDHKGTPKMLHAELLGVGTRQGNMGDTWKYVRGLKLEGPKTGHLTSEGLCAQNRAPYCFNSRSRSADKCHSCTSVDGRWLALTSAEVDVLTIHVDTWQTRFASIICLYHEKTQSASLTGRGLGPK